MTYDGTGNLVIAYNHLHLPEKISRNDTLLVKYAYLSDGMKASTLNTAGAGLVYRGSMSFRKDSQGVLSFESAPIATGHITSNGVRYHVADHLGSVRAVVDGASGALYEASDYAAYGVRSDAGNLPSSLSISALPSGEAPTRWHFTGQEDQGPVSASAALVPNPANATLPYTDFGSRHYSPTLRRWLVPDPLSEKYYDVSPYAYCAGDPVNCVDVVGAYTKVKDNGDRTYTVIGGELDDNLNVYVYYPDSEGEYTVRGNSIGQTAFSMSFYNYDRGEWASGAIIDLNDSSGSDFLYELAQVQPEFLSYMKNAQNGKVYDFKVTNGIPDGSGYAPYRGMLVEGVIASARDVGNIAAGFVSGLNGVSYSMMRFLFDAYQSYSNFRKMPLSPIGIKPPGHFSLVLNFPVSYEGPSSSIPQAFGWEIGRNMKHQK